MNLEKKLFPTLNGVWMYVDLDFMAENLHNFVETEINPFNNPHKMSKWISYIHYMTGIDYSYGGYLEDRRNLWKGHYHEEGKTIHLGVDFNVKANTPVSLPCDATVVDVFYDKDKNGGWGGRVTFECDSFYLIFAHMKNIDLEVNSKQKAGSIIGMVAEPELNGGWYEHLHLQCSTEFRPHDDAYSYSYSGIEKYFPNPFSLLK